jgi:acyl-CoA dehydrogenase
MFDPISVPKPSFMTEELEIFRDAVDRFVVRECVPHIDEWRRDREVPRELWRKAGEAGLLLASTPAEYGGGGGTLAHEAVIIDRLGRHDAAGFNIAVQNIGVAPYIARFASDEQKNQWLPKLASGAWIGAMAMSEPGAGSDLKAIRLSATRDGDSYVLNGQKLFTTMGWFADMLMVASKTDRGADAHGISLFIVETDTPGFSRGRQLDTLGIVSHGVAELFFDNVRVPAENLLGGVEGQGFAQMMTNLVDERMIGILEGMAMMERALQNTITYVNDRHAFGKRIVDFQNTQFVLADCKAEATIAKVFCNYLIERQLAGDLDVVTSAIGKLWISETQGKLVDKCLQMFGGYGYINEYPIAHMYKDARITRIGGGTSEIMRLIIGRSISN